MSPRTATHARRRFVLDDYARRLEGFLEEREAARRATARGATDVEPWSALHARHAELFRADTIRALQALADGDDEQATEARLLLSEAITGHLAHGLGDLSEQIASAERRAIIIWRGERIAYRDAPARVAEIAQRAERNGLDSSYREAMEAINPLREAAFERRAELLIGLGHDDETELIGRLHAYDPKEFGVELQRFLHESETVYYAALRRYLARIDIEQGDGSEADASHLLRGSGWDALFPHRDLPDVLRRTLEGMGLGAADRGVPQLSVAEPRGEAHAEVFAVRVPDDVSVLLAPAPGAEAYRAGLDALGEALYLASVSSDLGLGARRGGDPAIAGGYGFLLAQLQLEPEWLVGELGMEEGVVSSFCDFAAFRTLYRLRRDAALHMYELRLRGGVQRPLARAYFAGMLSLLSGVHVVESGFLAAVADPWAAASRTRGAWLGAALAGAMRREQGTTWWRRPEGGHTLRRAWARGGGWRSRDVVAHLGYDHLDWRPVLRHIRMQLIGELSGYGGPNITTRAGTRKV